LIFINLIVKTYYFIYTQLETLEILEITRSTSKRTLVIIMNKQKDKLCSVCQEQPTNKIKLIDCTHEFCDKCIKQWLQIKQNCPNCRNNITEQHEIELFGQKISPELEFEEFVGRVIPMIERIDNRPEFMEPIFWIAPLRQRRNAQAQRAQVRRAAIVVMEPSNTPVQSRPSTA